jgi:hypothetical protein
MGALADELVDVLGDAFSTPRVDLQTGMSFNGRTSYDCWLLIHTTRMSEPNIVRRLGSASER